METTETVTGCPGCGVIARSHGRRAHVVRDIPASGRPVVLVWNKRLWRCPEALCPRRTWSEACEAIGARATLTERARAWAMRRIGEDGETVAALACEFGVGWNTVMRAVSTAGR